MGGAQLGAGECTGPISREDWNGEFCQPLPGDWGTTAGGAQLGMLGWRSIKGGAQLDWRSFVGGATTGGTQLLAGDDGATAGGAQLGEGDVGL